MDRRRVACVLLAASPGTRETSCGRRATSPGTRETRESETDSQERSGVFSTCEGATALLGRPTRYLRRPRRAASRDSRPRRAASCPSTDTPRYLWRVAVPSSRAGRGPAAGCRVDIPSAGRRRRAVRATARATTRVSRTARTLSEFYPLVSRRRRDVVTSRARLPRRRDVSEAVEEQSRLLQNQARERPLFSHSVRVVTDEASCFSDAAARRQNSNKAASSLVVLQFREAASLSDTLWTDPKSLESL